MTQLGVISKFAEGALHSICGGLKAVCPPLDLGAANIRGRKGGIVTTSTLMQKTRCCCRIGLKFVFCFSLPVLAMFLLTSHCLRISTGTNSTGSFLSCPSFKALKFYIFILLCSTWQVQKHENYLLFLNRAKTLQRNTVLQNLEEKGLSFSSVFPFFCLCS